MKKEEEKKKNKIVMMMMTDREDLSLTWDLNHDRVLVFPTSTRGEGKVRTYSARFRTQDFLSAAYS
jgi:hypothetical protein